METAVASGTQVLPLKAIFSEFVHNFLSNTKAGDSLKSNPWAKALYERTVEVLGPLADSYGFTLRPMGVVIQIRRKNNQYITFCKPPLQTSRGFYPIIRFPFDTGRVEYALGYSDNNKVPEIFIETMRDVARAELPDFPENSGQGLPLKAYELGRTSDAELTRDLIRLLDVYATCVERLSEEIHSFGAQSEEKMTGVLTPDQLDELLDEYIAWCESNADAAHLQAEHSTAYASWNREYFRSLTIETFTAEMLKFVRQGGHIQTGGSRFVNLLQKSLAGREEEFRSHLLKVYEPDFDLETWWHASDAFVFFGKGTRSIFLHRAFPNKYTVFNEKALQGYRICGVLPRSRGAKALNYQQINDAAHELATKRPGKLTLFRADYLNHYITTPEGRAVLERLLPLAAKEESSTPDAPQVWLIGAGRGGSYSEDFITSNAVGVDFDISESLAPCDSRGKMAALIARIHPEDERPSGVDSCFDLAHVIQPGDVVVLRGGQKGISAIGVVTSGYRFRSDRSEFPHTCAVHWLSSEGWRLADAEKIFPQQTVVNITSHHDRLEQLRRVMNWEQFEPELQRLHELYRVAPPFSRIFADREEANQGFDLIKRTVDTFASVGNINERFSISLPKEGAGISVNYGSRLLLQFFRRDGVLFAALCTRFSDLGPGEQFEGGEFAVRGERAGLGLKHRLFGEFLGSPVLQERYFRALEETKAAYSNRTNLKRWHVPQLLEAAFNTTLRDTLLSHGLQENSNAYSIDTEPPMEMREYQVPKGRNVIYFGPPGTGKTFTLLRKEQRRFVAEAKTVTREEQLQALVADKAWWVVIAAALYKMGPSKVPALVKHPLMAARFATTSVKRPINNTWFMLQTRTTFDCPHVALAAASRQEPLIFFKSEDSVWSVLADKLADEAPEVLELAEAMEREIPPGEKILRYETVTFHQSFSYEDFIEGIKPRVSQEEGTTLGYEIQPGVFKRLCDRARADKAHEYAIFIDEINRGNVASIFGELISLIEEDKREGAPHEVAVRLPYSKELFTVPANVSIIGTMNSADRSVEALDTALRRRFTFIEVAPSADVLREHNVTIEGLDIPRMFEVINQRLEKLLNRDHQIGHAYFLGLNQAGGSLSALRDLFGTRIIPLLQEYFYSDVGRIGLVLGTAFVEQVPDVSFGDFHHPDVDLLRERQVYRLKDPAQLSLENFRSIYS